MTPSFNWRAVVGLSLGLLCAPSLQADEHRIEVMAFNVENLFDTKHDDGKDDHTYLPLSDKQSPEHQKRCKKISDKNWRKECLRLDWSDEVLGAKMKNISEVILQSNPDIAVLPEVENVSVLQELVDRHLASAGYTTVVLLEGEDERGIDVGMISKLPLADSAKIHSTPFKERGFLTRGILEASFTLPNSQKITVFGVHFPSPHNNTSYRVQSIEHLNELAKTAAEHSDMIIAAGDFNVTIDEDQRLYKELAGASWRVTHYEGCKNCDGTNYYRRGGTWSFLDAILLYKADDRLDSNGKYDVESIRVIKDVPVQTNREGMPFGFDPETKEGVSDHFPIAASILLKP